MKDFETITGVAEAQERAEKILWYIGYGCPQKLARRFVMAKYGLIDALTKVELLKFARFLSRLGPDACSKLLEDSPEEWREKLKDNLERERLYRVKQGGRVPAGISAKDAAARYAEDRTDAFIVKHWLELPTGMAGLAFLSESQSMIVFEYLRKHCRAPFVPTDPAVFRQRRMRLGLRTANPRHPIYKEVALERRQARLGLTFVDQRGNRKWTWFQLKPRNPGGGDSD
ncbi:MAG: hypothetical protein JNN17_06970 [Verrucomicrobiaceae bacterium]|nr:hypothetical protein [Verrucomicrobiaceae bacterium]